MTHRTLSGLTAAVALLVAPLAHAQGEEPAETPKSPASESSVEAKAPEVSAEAAPADSKPPAVEEKAAEPMPAASPEGLTVNGSA